MSIQSLSWAWEQKLPPGLKFVLIAISDSCGEIFTFDEAIHRAEELTCMDKAPVISAFRELQQYEYIIRDYSNKSGEYYYIPSGGYQPPPPPKEKKRKLIPGYVYLIQSPTGAYKIGRTINPENRMRTFSVKLPFEVEYVCVIQTEDMYGLERKLHKTFDNKRVGGEFFSLAPEDVEYIKGLAQ